MNIFACILFAALTPLTSADKFSFTVPNVPKNICGKIMGKGPDYRVIRSEDIAFIYEAIEERDIIGNFTWPTYDGIDSHVIKRINVDPPRVGGWYLPDVEFITDPIDVSRGPGKAAWDEGGARKAIVTKNYGDLQTPRFKASGHIGLYDICSAYTNLSKYTICGYTPSLCRAVGSNRIVHDKILNVYHAADEREGPWYPITESWSTNYIDSPSIVFEESTSTEKWHYRRSYYSNESGMWIECAGSPYINVTKYTYRKSAQRYESLFCIDVMGCYDTTNWTHRVGESADVYILWTVTGGDDGVKYYWPDRFVAYTNEQYVYNAQCVSKHTGSYYGQDQSGKVVFRVYLEDFPAAVSAVAESMGLSTSWDVDADDPETPPNPSEDPEWESVAHTMNSVSRHKRLTATGNVCYVVLRPDLPTKIQ